MNAAVRLSAAEYLAWVSSRGSAAQRVPIDQGRQPRPGGTPGRKRAAPEDALQRDTAEWVVLHQAAHPVLCWMFHAPNGGKRPRGEAGKLRAMGVRPGVPDWMLPFPSPAGRWMGLAIELKSATGRTTPEQEAWLAQCKQAGWLTAVCRGLDGFADVVKAYLSGGVLR